MSGFGSSTASITGSTAERGRALVEEIVDLGPRRVMGSDTEKHAQELLGRRLGAHGARLEWHRFKWNRSLYAVLMLHFGVATLGTLFWSWGAPAVALGLHVLAAASYVLDSQRVACLIRRAFPFRRSQNLLATLASRGPMRRRIVFLSHADAAYTGLLFDPRVIRAATTPPSVPGLGFLRKGLLVAVGGMVGLAVIDALSIAGVWPGAGWAVALVWVLSAPSIVGFVLNVDVVLRNRVVPGANDNLTGCAAAVELAGRLTRAPLDGVEVVFAITGAEEAGTGGANALALTMRDAWLPSETMIIGIDTLSGGTLRWFEEGELVSVPPPRELTEVALQVANGEPRFAELEAFSIPSGATDAWPFLRQGWPALTFGCVDPHIGAPRNYHHPSDTPANVDWQQYALVVDFVEAFARRLSAP